MARARKGAKNPRGAVRNRPQGEPFRLPPCRGTEAPAGGGPLGGQRRDAPSDLSVNKGGGLSINTVVDPADPPSPPRGRRRAHSVCVASCQFGGPVYSSRPLWTQPPFGAMFCHKLPKT
ncbi:hypothetical protein GWK47_000993 [Chionoecetes opilio]|uniref:Uncharacterized protein n=1 Tax=Chionoecetes opilio TaxID=41210 RepID=A0A8J5CQT1_CHIOP|nr:hypothetical protein GWK47_000993 [Chionoecetes opilio]